MTAETGPFGKDGQESIPGEEINVGLTAALDMLAAMRGPRNELQEIEFQASAESGLPRAPVLIRAYGNMMQDDPRSGVWKFAQEGYEHVYIFSTNDGVFLKSRIDPKLRIPVGDVEEDRALECTRLLGLARRQFEELNAAADKEGVEPKERTRRSFGRSLLGRRK